VTGRAFPRVATGALLAWAGWLALVFAGPALQAQPSEAARNALAQLRAKAEHGRGRGHMGGVSHRLGRYSVQPPGKVGVLRCALR